MGGAAAAGCAVGTNCGSPAVFTGSFGATTGLAGWRRIRTKGHRQAGPPMLLSAYFLNANGHSTRMIVIGRAYLSEREEIKKLIAEYHRSEGLRPNKERIAWAVRLQLRDTPGLLLVARDKDTIVGVALAVYSPSAELGRVMTVNDFFVSPDHRRKGVGQELVKHMVEECKRMKIDEIGLQVLYAN